MSVETLVELEESASHLANAAKLLHDHSHGAPELVRLQIEAMQVRLGDRPEADINHWLDRATRFAVDGGGAKSRLTPNEAARICGSLAVLGAERLRDSDASELSVALANALKDEARSWSRISLEATADVVLGLIAVRRPGLEPLPASGLDSSLAEGIERLMKALRATGGNSRSIGLSARLVHALLASQQHFPSTSDALALSARDYVLTESNNGLPPPEARRLREENQRLYEEGALMKAALGIPTRVGYSVIAIVLILLIAGVPTASVSWALFSDATDPATRWTIAGVLLGIYLSVVAFTRGVCLRHDLVGKRTRSLLNLGSSGSDRKI